MSRTLVVLSILAVSASVSAQDASGRTASLGWVRLPGAESCPSSQAIAQATDSLLGRGAFVPPAQASLAIEGRVEPRAGGFRATLAVGDASGAAIGERVVEADGACDALLSPLTIVLAILVDPDATPIAPPPPAPPPPPPPPIVETRIVTERVVVRVPSRSPPWRLEIDLGALASIGATPFVSPGVELFVFLTPPGFVPIGLHGWIAPWSRAELGPGDYVDQLTSWAGITVCPIAGHDETFSLAGCAGLDVGAAFVVGDHSLLQPLTEHERITGGLDLSFRARVHAIGPLWFVLSVAMLVNFRTDPFLRGSPPIRYYAPEQVALIVTLGPSFTFE